MKINDYGDIEPLISEDQCIGCVFCVSVCPVNNKIELHHPKNVYAAYSNDIEIHLKSASGGVASELSNFIIQKGGCVYGCEMTPTLYLEFVKIDLLSEINRIQGSTYFHSQVNTSFKKVKLDLAEGRDVLFVGLPCQNAGLQNL